jgi:hypothetical protein
MTIPSKRPTRKPTAAKAAPIVPPGLTLSRGMRIYQLPEIQVNGVTIAPAGEIEDPNAPAILTDADVSFLIRWAVQAAVDDVAAAIVSAMPKEHAGVLKHVIRNADGMITTVIEENATLRDVPSGVQN